MIARETTTRSEGHSTAQAVITCSLSSMEPSSNQVPLAHCRLCRIISSSLWAGTSVVVTSCWADNQCLRSSALALLLARSDSSCALWCVPTSPRASDLWGKLAMYPLVLGLSHWGSPVSLHAAHDASPVVVVLLPAPEIEYWLGSCSPCYCLLWVSSPVLYCLDLSGPRFTWLQLLHSLYQLGHQVHHDVFLSLYSHDQGLHYSTQSTTVHHRQQERFCL